MNAKQRINSLYKALFHKRNIIVMSERSTSHLSMSAKLQVAILAAFVAVIGTASFSTGKYMAAQNVISEQGKTIKSVANSRIETSYGYAVPSLSASAPMAASPQAFNAPLTDPAYQFSTMDEGKLVAHIAFLENRIEELGQTNQDIIQVVRKTADGQIKDLEKVIQQTGLSAKTLKSHAKQEKKIKKRTSASLSKDEGGQGGPFIPDYWDEDMRQFAEDLEHSTNDLFVLRQILKLMPLAKPMSNARYSSSYGHRRDPFTGRSAFHSGLDLASKTTPQIIATADGVVSLAERRGAYGNMVEIKHGLGISTRYGHMSRILVTPGSRVKKGQVIGIQGATGRASGPHLHYEVRFNNRPLNPRGFINAGSSYVSKN